MDEKKKWELDYVRMGNYEDCGDTLTLFLVIHDKSLLDILVTQALNNHFDINIHPHYTANSSDIVYSVTIDIGDYAMREFVGSTLATLLGAQ